MSFLTIKSIDRDGIDDIEVDISALVCFIFKFIFGFLERIASSVF